MALQFRGLPSASELFDLAASAGTGVTINENRSPFQLAPEGVEFDLTLTGFDTNTPGTLQSYHASYGDKIVWWDYGDGYTFIHPAQVIAWDAADGGTRSNSQYSRGPLGCHVFRSAGTYTVKAFVYEISSGKIGQGTLEITVGNPDTYYSTTKTIYCASDGDYTNKPTGAQQTNSLDLAISTLVGASTPHRIMLKRGLSYSTTGANTATNGYGTEASFRIEAQSGAGAQPIVNTSGSFSEGANWFYDNPRVSSGASSKAELLFYDIDLRGPWDSTTVSGDSPDCLESGSDGSTHILVDRCRMTGFRSNVNLINTTGNVPSSVAIVNDTWITNWRRIGIYDDAQRRINVVGCGIVQDVDAVTLQTSGQSLGSMRLATSSRICLIANDCFSNTGWSAYVGSMLAIQPALRLLSSGNYLYGQLNMWGNVIESGRYAMYIKPFSDGDARVPVNSVVEGNFMIAGFQAECVMQNAHPATIRDNQFALAGLTDASAFGGRDQILTGMIEGVGGTSGANETENSTRPLNIYNNTLVNLKTKTIPAFEDTIAALNESLANNILHQPELGSPSIPYTNMGTTVAVVPRYKGYRTDSSTLTTELATQAAAGEMLRPQAGSTALDASTGSLISPLHYLPDITADAVIDSADRDVGWAEL